MKYLWAVHLFTTLYVKGDYALNSGQWPEGVVTCKENRVEPQAQSTFSVKCEEMCSLCSHSQESKGFLM